jgi:hypothetical protein
MMAGLFAAFALLIGVVLVLAARTVPPRADHERELRAHVTDLVQEKKPETEADGLLQGILRFGNAIAQGADVSYIDALGFEYEKHTFYSVVKDPKKPKDDQLVSFGALGQVWGPRSKGKGSGTPKPKGPID